MATVPEVLKTVRIYPAEGAHPEAALRWIRQLTQMLDSNFKVPGTNWTFGWDGLIGLVPGVGDLVTGALSCYVVILARRMGAPKHVIVRMLGNVAVDLAAGAVPVVGDIMDFAWKANRKNLRLLERHLQKQAASRSTNASWR